MPAHIDALLQGLGDEHVSHILVTHTHADHSPAAQLLRDRTGAATYGFGKHSRHTAGDLEGGVDRDFVPDIEIEDGDKIEGSNWKLEVIHTPGHCSNHICFAEPDLSALFCGDHLMAWSTPVILPPDGSVRDYLNSLEKLSARPEITFYPTHGKPIIDPNGFITQVKHHRLQRVSQIYQQISIGNGSIPAIRKRLYQDIPSSLYAGAELSIDASIRYLVEQGKVVGNAFDGFSLSTD